MKKQRWWRDEDAGEVLTPYNAQKSDPLFQTPKGWFFCDEVWADFFGPFASRGEASLACGEYAKSL